MTHDVQSKATSIELRRLRRDLDYPTETEAGSGVVVDEALRRRWLLATTAKVAG